MDSKPSPLHSIVTVAAVLASALAFFFGEGLHPIWWLVWLAPLPLLLIAPRLPLRTVLIVSCLAAGAGQLGLWPYFREAPILISLLAILVPGIVFALAVLLFRRRVLRERLLQAAIIFPSFWVTYEYLLAMFSPHSTAFNLGYTQMNFLPILQIASLTGIWGISFSLLLFPATLAALWTIPGQARQKKLLAAGAGVFLLAVLGFGEWRLHSPVTANSVKVALIASDLPQNTLPTTQEDSMRLLHDYANEVDKVSSQQPMAIVLPEKIGVIRESYLDSADSLLASSASHTHAVLVVGLIRRDPHGLWNEARVYLPEGGAPLTYEKHHMLPPFESQFTVGTSRTILHEPSGTWGITICKDMDFPQLSREYAREGTALLLVPAWDFDFDGWLHGRMAILRGVEDGFSIARAPRHGILTITDDRGRVLAERGTNSAPFATLVATIPVAHHVTLYSRWGDWFAWLCILLFLASLFLPRKAEPPAGQ
jgi:apolipoprotein N-acyltransferase